MKPPPIVGSVVLMVTAVFANPSTAQENDVESVIRKLASAVVQNGGKTVAVADFTDLQGRVTELGRLFAEEASVALVNAGSNLKVIDRGHIRTLLAELKLSDSGMIDPSTAKELGRVAGVDVLLTGTVTDLGGNIRVLVKALQSETAAIMAAGTIESPSNAARAGLFRRDVPPGGVIASAPPSAPSVRAYQNDFLLVTVDSVAVSQDGKRVSLTLSFENKGPSDEYLSTDCCPGPTLSDNTANSWRFNYPASSGLLYQSFFFREEDREHMTRMAPGSRHSVVLYFESNLAKSERSSSVGFAMSVHRRLERQIQTFSVGISNIPVDR